MSDPFDSPGSLRVSSALAVTAADVVAPDHGQARSAIQHYAGTGDVSQLTNDERAAFILYYCQSLGLNAATGAVEIIEFYDPETKGRVAKVYVKAEATKQLGNMHRIRVETLSEQMVGNSLFKVTVRGHQPDGRTYDEVGYVSLVDRQGNTLGSHAYKNALMKCHTVAKRRLILGMIGLGMPPEDGKRLYLGSQAEILEHPTDADRYLNDNPDVAAITGGRPRFESLEPPDEDGAPNQRPRAEVTDPPKPPPGPRPTLRPTKEQVDRLCGAWFAAVKGSSLDSDDARHQFVGRWTATEQWPDAKQTESVRAFFARATEREAGDFLAHVRALVADERAANDEALREARGSGMAASDETADEEPF